MSFDRLAPYYDWLEAITAGNRLQRARTVWLDELRDCRHILSVGEGHGRFAAACAARFPQTELTCLDASPLMLGRARERLKNSSAHLNYICADFGTWTPDRKYDALVTCFFLDCFTPELLARTMSKLADCALPSAVWLVVDFAIPPRGPARWRAQAMHALMYAFFRRCTSLPACRLTPPDALLRSHGFHLVKRREYEWGLLHADLWRRD